MMKFGVMLCSWALVGAAVPAGAGQIAFAEETEAVGTASDETAQAVEAEILALNIQSREDAKAFVPVYVKYQALNTAQKESISEEAKTALDAAVESAAEYNHSDQGVTVEGDLPWYTQIQVSELDTAGEEAEGLTVVLPYDITLWDLYTDSEYQLDGETVTIGIPMPDIEYEGDLKVIHTLHDGSTEVLNTTVQNGTVFFEASSFSTYSLAGETIIGIGPGSSLNSSKKTETQSGSSASQTTAGSTSQTGSSTGSTGTSSSGRVSTNPAETGDTTEILPLVVTAAAAVLVICAVIYADWKSKKNR